MIIDSGADDAAASREWPLLDVLRGVIQIAARNQPPTTEDVKQRGQESGFFGDWIVPPSTQEESPTEETTLEAEALHSTT